MQKVFVKNYTQNLQQRILILRLVIDDLPLLAYGYHTVVWHGCTVENRAGKDLFWYRFYSNPKEIPYIQCTVVHCQQMLST